MAKRTLTTVGLSETEVNSALAEICAPAVTHLPAVSELDLAECRAELESLGDPNDLVTRLNDLWIDMKTAHKAAVELSEKLINKVKFRRDSVHGEIVEALRRVTALKARAAELEKAGAEEVHHKVTGTAGSIEDTKGTEKSETVAEVAVAETE